MASGARPTTAWDLTALLNAADPRVPLPERHLWLVRLLEWLRHPAPDRGEASTTPLPALRLKHLLNVLAQNDEPRERVRAMLAAFVRDVDVAALCADFGYAPRIALASELRHRIGARLLPATPDTRDLAALFPLLFRPDDAHWLSALDADTLARLAELLGDDAGAWRRGMLDAITILASAVHAAGYTPMLRWRMDAALLADEPFRQLALAADRTVDVLRHGAHADALREASYLRALLDACRRASDSIAEHLEEHGVSMEIVFQTDQLRDRCDRIERLLDCVLSPQPAPAAADLLRALLRVLEERQGIRALLAQHYSLLARKVAERSAETGETYITRTRAAWRDMLARAAGGGAVLAGTTLLKFAIAAIGLSAFWGGVWAGVNYAASFVLIYLLHWTVATKQPAMTAPAMAARLRDVQRSAGHDDAAIEGFVDEVARLMRSQFAGIVGNLAVVFPLVLAVQLGARAVFGAPAVGADAAHHVLESLTALGPTPLYAAFTGVLLFLSSQVAGWAENWFVFHRLDSALAWHPRVIARLGRARAQRWAAWWREHVSGLAANVSLGLMLGLVPPLLAFVGLPIDVRHVTLSTGQLAAALGALGTGVLADAAFWWCAAGIVLTGALNVTVSFVLAFRVALRSRGIRLAERARLYAAWRRRLLRRPLSFLLPPQDGADTAPAA